MFTAEIALKPAAQLLCNRAVARWFTGGGVGKGVCLRGVAVAVAYTVTVSNWESQGIEGGLAETPLN